MKAYIEDDVMYGFTLRLEAETPNEDNNLRDMWDKNTVIKRPILHPDGKYGTEFASISLAIRDRNGDKLDLKENE